MASVWIIKDDGTRQCDDRNQGVSVEDMQKELEALGATVLNAEKRQDCRFIAAVCGLPTGRVNAYEISEEDWEKIQSGFVGLSGFREWDCDGEGGPRVAELGGEIPWPLARKLSIASSVQSMPTLIRELIGRQSRYYEEGTPITKDFRPDRVNIVTEKNSNKILDIWFG